MFYFTKFGNKKAKGDKIILNTSFQRKSLTYWHISLPQSGIVKTSELLFLISYFWFLWWGPPFGSPNQKPPRSCLTSAFTHCFYHLALLVLPPWVPLGSILSGPTPLPLSQFPFMFYLGSCSSFLQKAMTPHSSTLAWKIPWTEEPGRLQSMRSLRVWHDWATSLSLFTFMHWRRKWQPTPVFLPGESQGRGSLVGCCLWGRTELDTTEET